MTPVKKSEFVTLMPQNPNGMPENPNGSQEVHDAYQALERIHSNCTDVSVIDTCGHVQAPMRVKHLHRVHTATHSHQQVNTAMAV